MQRSRGRSESSVLQEWGGGPCGWRGVCEGEGRKGGGVLQGLERHGEDLGFYPEGDGSSGGAVGRGERSLTQGLTGALQWPLPEERTVGSRERSLGEGDHWPSPAMMGAGPGGSLKEGNGWVCG